MGDYRRAATGDFPECIEVYPEETPWTAPKIRLWKQLELLQNSWNYCTITKQLGILIQ